MSSLSSRLDQVHDPDLFLGMIGPVEDGESADHLYLAFSATAGSFDVVACVKRIGRQIFDEVENPLAIRATNEGEGLIDLVAYIETSFMESRRLRAACP